MAALRRPQRRMARRLARKYQFMMLAAASACLFVWHVVTRDDCPGCVEEDLGAEALHGGRRLFDIEDQFTLEQRRHGAVLLHCIGLLYMFAAIAIVCDECFVPALEVITQVLDITPDVAGATFMAAGGSAPEFFTSLIGSLITESDVGTGTIIGSAVFNVLFVIGACAIVAPEPLQLTWFPLFRDSCFYAIDLIVVTCVFFDEKVMWYEALILFLLYLSYITFMKFSTRVEGLVVVKPNLNSEDDNNWAISRERLEQNADVGGTAGTGDTGDIPPPREDGHHPVLQDVPQTRSANFLHSSSSVHFHDQASEGGDHKKHFKHHSMRASQQFNSVKHLDSAAGSTGGSGDVVLPAGEPHAHAVHPVHAHAEAAVPEPVPEAMPEPTGSVQHMELTNVVPAPTAEPVPAKNPNNSSKILEDQENEDGEKDEEEDEDKPLTFWPPEDGKRKDWIYYLLTLPITFVCVLTIPDVRRAGWKKYFPLTFFMSILWIAFFTWAMVWFCRVIGATAGLSDSILGMTVIAAGTSVPDMLTSMIVAREGEGDMAVSSSIGSNIFDVTVGLPVPWLLFTAVKRKPVSIVNTGLEISVMILLAMLGLTITTIMCHGWSMTKMMGGSMMILYAIFQGISVGLFVYTENGGSLKLIHV